jgi:CheY-like chemotaxis protein
MLTDLMGGEMTVRSTPGQGTVFSVRLFLPELHGAAARRVALPAPVMGYEGPRRRVLVVDNEESDRELIARWLQPLGFEVMLATSGHDALALLDGVVPGSERAPHAVFMDLAMPGIDGWETLRRLRAGGWAALPMAIVSANAFDKGLQAEAADGRPADQAFFVKPVRRDDLTGWLQQRLGLRWVHAPVVAVPPPRPPEAEPPSAARLLPLAGTGAPGLRQRHVRWLDDWVRRPPRTGALRRRLRPGARIPLRGHRTAPAARPPCWSPASPTDRAA